MPPAFITLLYWDVVTKEVIDIWGFSVPFAFPAWDGTVVIIFAELQLNAIVQKNYVFLIKICRQFVHRYG